MIEFWLLLVMIAALGPQRRISRASSNATLSVNIQPPTPSHITPSTPFVSSSKSRSIASENEGRSVARSKLNTPQNSKRPTTAPTIKRSPPVAYSNKQSTNFNVEKEQKVPKRNVINSAQRRQMVAKRSSNSIKSQNSSVSKDNVGFQKPEMVIKKAPTSKLRQDRNYQPPRRRTRKLTSEEHNVYAQQGIVGRSGIIVN